MISVSFVSYNSAECLQAFFRCLDSQVGITWEAFAVDNASTDDSARMIRAWGKANLICHDRNLGFGVAHNRQLGRMQGEYVLFVNPDVQFQSDLLRILADHLDRNRRLVVVGPGLVDAGTPYPPLRRYPGEHMANLLERVDDRGFAAVHGSCFLMRRTVWEELNGFDADYFLYAEELDLCLRARRAGWQIGWTDQTLAVHVGRHSQGCDSLYVQKQREFAGTLVFWRKHFGPTQLRQMVSYEYSALTIRLALGLVPSGRHEEFRARRDASAEWLGDKGWRVPWRPAGHRVLKAALQLARLEVGIATR